MADPLSSALIGALSALGGGGGVWAFLTRRGDRAAEQEESEVDRMRAEIKELRQGEQRCQEEVTALKARVAVVEHHHTSYIPRWIKDQAKRVIWLNDRAFISIFAPLGLAREDVLDRTFADMLDPNASAELDRLDQQALAHPDVPASNVIQLHPLLPLMVVVKVAAVGREGELVYEGYAYRTNDRLTAEAIGAARQIGQIEASADRVIEAE